MMAAASLFSKYISILECLLSPYKTFTELIIAFLSPGGPPIHDISLQRNKARLLRMYVTKKKKALLECRFCSVVWTRS